jgi:DNA invertase Pin-like site-specific DNA recombinase
MLADDRPSGDRQIVAYYRVSTQLQGIAGLGMEAQRRSVEAYALQQRCQILASYSEVETGRKQSLRNRPELVKAIAHARRSGAILAIARLDRLARNLYVTAQLLESGVDFVACDNPHANRLTIQILAAMAEHEGRLISERCKASAAVLKARGTVFGRPKGYRVAPEDAKRYAATSAASRRANTIEAYADLVPLIIRLRYVPMSLAAIAGHLNDLGHCSRKKLPLSADIIRLILQRAGLGTLTLRPATLYGTVGLDKARANLAAINQAWDAATYASIRPIVTKMRAKPQPYAVIAGRLNLLGYRTKRGKIWRIDSLRRLLDRLGFAESPARRKELHALLASRGTAAAAKRRRNASGMMRHARRLSRTNRTWLEVAEALNVRGYRTLRGTRWTAPSVWQLLERERRRRDAIKE